MERKISVWFALKGPETPPPGRVPCVWLAYRLEQGRLVRQMLPARARGGMMGITAAKGPGDPGKAAREILMECTRRGMGGVLWDLPDRPESRETAARIAPLLAQRGLGQLVPLFLAESVPQARVLVPSGISGGSLRQLLETCGAKFGPRRCCLELTNTAARFSMPCSDPAGTALTREQLREALAGRESWLCPQLCLRYCTLPGHEFLLFDDRETGARKLALAEELGFPSALIRADQWGPEAAALAT